MTPSRFAKHEKKKKKKKKKTAYGVITQFRLFEKYTTEKRSTVVFTSSENSNSDFILIALKNKFINKLGRAGVKKRRQVTLERDSARMEKRTRKAHCL